MAQKYAECPRCGHSNPVSYYSCAGCGSALDPAKAHTYSPGSPTKIPPHKHSALNKKFNLSLTGSGFLLGFVVGWNISFFFPGTQIMQIRDACIAGAVGLVIGLVCDIAIHLNE